MPAATNSQTTVTTPERFSITSGTETLCTPFATPSLRRIDSRGSGTTRCSVAEPVIDVTVRHGRMVRGYEQGALQRTDRGHDADERDCPTGTVSTIRQRGTFGRGSHRTHRRGVSSQGRSCLDHPSRQGTEDFTTQTVAAVISPHEV